MLVGRVTGNVVSTNKCDSLRGAKLLIVQPVDLETLQMKDDYVICVDDVGAAQMIMGDTKLITSVTICGVIDSYSWQGQTVHCH